MSSEKMKPCKTCGQMIAKKAKKCPHCGAKNKKPVYKRFWFWLLCIIVALFIYGKLSSITRDATVTLRDGTTIVCDGYEYRDLYDKYPNDKSNPYFGATVVLNDRVEELSFGGDSTQYLHFKGGWIIPYDDSIKVGSVTQYTAIVAYQNWIGGSDTMLRAE